MRNLKPEEAELVFTKLSNYIGDNLEKLLKQEDEHVFQIIKDRVYFMSKSLCNQSTTLNKECILSAGILLGKFTHSGKFRLHVTALPVITPFAQNKVWVKQSSELSFMYGKNITKAGLARMTENTPAHQGVLVMNMNNHAIGFGVSAKSTADTTVCDPSSIVVYHQDDIGTYLRDEASIV